ncbi:MAG: 2-phospho-L-lactate transferase CofD family protein [Ardenticatenaceae bacterium]|nr:2-phospho-L-lactate transferase CofD family protein [Ardenticatenaceae bacterium]HBY98984.1 hypothetical protein [Chloroflexota bacterium]
MQQRLSRWLLPGLGIKRWLLMLFVGLLLLALGLAYWLTELYRMVNLPDIAFWVTLQFIPKGLRGLLFVLVGGALTWIGWSRTSRYLVRTLVPERQDQSLAQLVYERARLEVGRPVVVMGGGTGLLPIVRALKQTHADVNLKVILSPTETGRLATQLRDELGLAPNQVIFPTSDDVRLWAELENGRLIEGAATIGHYNNGVPISRVFFSRDIRRMKVWENVQGELSASLLQAYAPEVNPEVLATIKSAELIVVAPGHLYTGLLPLLTMPGVASMIETSEAKLVFVANLMTIPGKTARFTVADYLIAIRTATGIEMDYVVVNQGDISRDLLEKYYAEGADIVRLRARSDAISRLTFADTGEETTLVEGAVVVSGHLVSEAPQMISYQTPDGQTSVRELPVARHDPARLARVLDQLLVEE